VAKINATVVIDRPLDVVWDYVSDWRNATSYIFGLQKYQPIGEQERGVGTKVELAVKLGPTTQESVVEYVEWVDREVLRNVPVSGFQQGTAIRFAPEGEGTRVTIDGEFSLPGGIAGRVLGKTIEPAAKLTASQSLKNLKALLEKA
jgi:carbon monoxide dehydrogenase subunit G